MKWPNDVLLGDRKVCGILVERVHVRAHGSDKPLAVVGIGINVDQRRGRAARRHRHEPRGSPRRPVDRTELFGQVLHDLRAWLGMTMGSPHMLVANYRGLCATLDRDVRVDLPDGSVLEGRATGVDEHGRLEVESGGRVVAVAAGDVVHVRTPR